MGIKIETVKTRGVKMDYFRFGNGGRTFVMLPGISIVSVMMSADLIAKQYEDLTSDFTFYVFDRASDIPSVYPVSAMAEDTLEAIKALGLSDIYCFGASQGGMIALTMAAMEPSLFAGLVAGSSCCSDSFCNDALREWVDLARKGDAKALCHSFGQAVYPKSFYLENIKAFEGLALLATPGDLSRFAAIASGTIGFDITGDLGKITCPVLAIGASDDRVLDPSGSSVIASKVPRGSLHMYDGFGHAAFDMAPDYRDRIRDFFLNCML